MSWELGVGSWELGGGRREEAGGRRQEAGGRREEGGRAAAVHRPALGYECELSGKQGELEARLKVEQVRMECRVGRQRVGSVVSTTAIVVYITAIAAGRLGRVEVAGLVGGEDTP